MFKPLNTRCWENFLTANGYKHVRTAGSHDQWTKPNHRTIPVWGNEKQIPAFHLKTSCKAIGCTLDDLYAWAAINC